MKREKTSVPGVYRKLNKSGEVFSVRWYTQGDRRKGGKVAERTFDSLEEAVSFKKNLYRTRRIKRERNKITPDDQTVRGIRTHARKLLYDGMTDTYLIAEMVAAAVPDDQLRAVVEELMPLMVKNIVVNARRYSNKIAGVEHPFWSTHLAALYPVDGGREMKSATDLTADDCDHLAIYYAEQAGKHQQISGYFAEAAENLRNTGARTLGDLYGVHAHEIRTGMAYARRAGHLGTKVRTPERSEKRIVELKGVGYSNRQIAGIMNEERLPSAKGGPWTPTMVRGVLVTVGLTPASPSEGYRSHGRMNRTEK